MGPFVRARPDWKGISSERDALRAALGLLNNDHQVQSGCLM